MTEASTDITTQAVSPQTETNFRTDFELRRELPEQLKPLIEISSNFYWSWQPEGIALFRDLDPALWDKCEQNPRLLFLFISTNSIFAMSFKVFRGSSYTSLYLPM